MIFRMSERAAHEHVLLYRLCFELCMSNKVTLDFNEVYEKVYAAFHLK